jgi:type I restriction enzyme, S subunit
MVVNSMSYATYDSYKDSGVDWLGEIPSDWDLIPNKHIFKLKNIKVGKKSSEYDLLSLTLKGVIKRDMENPEGKFPAEFDTYQEVKNGNFIFCMFDVQETPRTVGLSKFDGMITGAYTVFDVNENYNRDFLYYFYLNLDLDKRLKPLYRGLRNTIPKEWFLNFKTFVPSFKQQKAIANFLDDKTAQIDQAIALEQQQIEKLNEYKQIVIQNAVTKGLNPNAPMKDSGVEWIGDIPEHWNVIRFRNAFRFNKGLNITKENLNDEQGILCLNYGEIHSKYGFEFIPNVHPLKFVDESYLKNNQKSLLNDGDFVFADTSEDIEGSGNFSYINGQDLVFAGYHTLIAKPKINFNSRFIAYVLDSSAFRNQVRVRVKGVKVFSITQAILKTTFIWLPTEQEQNEIVKYLDEKMQKFNNAKIAYQIQIDRLKEYKNILINQAVTGKIKI